MKYIRITCILLTSVILFSPGIFIEASSELDDREAEEKYYRLLKEKSKEAAIGHLLTLQRRRAAAENLLFIEATAWLQQEYRQAVQKLAQTLAAETVQLPG